jgi:multiple sugar transport system substrate-binding protein
MQNQAIEVFHEKYPGIQVNPQPVAFSGYWDQLQVEAIAANTPDVFTSNEAWLSSLRNGGVLADLRGVDTVDLTNFTTDSLGAAVGPDGGVYAIPTGGNAAAILVNWDVLHEAGIDTIDDENWTWEDFKNYATQVSDANLTNHAGEPVFGVSFLGGAQVAQVWANQTDGGIFTPAGQLNWSQDSMEGYLQFIADMQAAGATPAAAVQQEFSGTGPAESMMALGRSAFQPQWSNQLGAVAGAAGGANIGLIRYPGDFTSAHMGTWLNPSMFFAVSSNAQSPEAAGCLVNFMMNSAEAAEIMGIDRGVPFNPVTRDIIEANLTGQAATQAEFMNRIAANAAASIPQPELSDDLNNLLLATERVSFGVETPAVGAAGMHSDLAGAIVN